MTLRDWWLRCLKDNTYFDADSMRTQKEWLIEQVESEKERADRAKLSLNNATYLVEYAKGKLVQAEAREKKLREAIEEVLRDAFKWENPYEGYNDLQKVLASLYPKEEEAK